MFRLLTKLRTDYLTQNVVLRHTKALFCSVHEIKRLNTEIVEEVEDQLFGHFYGAADNSFPKGNKTRGPRRRSNARSQQTRPIVVPDASAWKFTNLNLHDPILGRLILSARSSIKQQRKQQQIIIEGKRLIKDALEFGGAAKACSLFVSDIKLLDDFLHYRQNKLKNCSIYKANQKDLATWSSLTTCPGILGIFDRPSNVEEPHNSLPITVICDNIREPNNLGSILRICAALPCRRVLVVKGCTDPWESKSIRGGAGAHFHIPVEYPIKWDEVPDFVKSTRPPTVFIADNKQHGDGQFRSIDQDLLGDIDGDLLVIIGGETHGVSAEAYRFLEEMSNRESSAALHIPMAKHVESINTSSALAVILYELRKQLKQKLDKSFIPVT